MRRTLRRGARCVGALAALCGVLLEVSGQVVSAQGVEDVHGAVLARVVAAWNVGDVAGVVAQFAPDAVAGDGWSYWKGTTGLGGWVAQEARAGVLLAVVLEEVDGTRATWRWSASAAADRTLALPPIERWADVEVRDGVITSMTFRGDPQSRERRARAVNALAAQVVQSVQSRVGVPLPRSATPLGRSAAGLLVAAVACVVAVGVALRPRRTGP